MSRKMQTVLLHRQERGSVFFLVLALLSVLVLLATTLTYVTRLEMLAASNTGRAVQARMSAVSGFSAAVRALSEQAGMARETETPLPPPPGPIATPTPYPTPGYPGPSGEIRLLGRQTSADSAAARERLERIAPLAEVIIFDESSRVNVNTIRPQMGADLPGPAPLAPDGGLTQKTLQDIIAHRLATHGLDRDRARPIAAAIMETRFGADGVAGDLGELRPVSDDGPILPPIPGSFGFLNPGGSLPTRPDPADAPHADLRRMPPGDDALFRNGIDIQVAAGMSNDEASVVLPILTTQSSSLEYWSDAEGTLFPKVPINQASAEQIFHVLKRLYPGEEEAVLAQFAVNIVDRRDSDSIPTIYSEPGRFPVIGVEINVLISEVCPDVITLEEDGNNGEYIEIYNPLPEPVNLSGWRLDWGAGNYVFTETLPANGFLIITDDIDNRNDPNPEDDAPGMGSFYHIFRVLPRSPQEQLIELPGMDIPNGGGMIQLFDPWGNLIDYLVYQDSWFNGINRGFKKESLFSHRGVGSQAAPFVLGMRIPTDDLQQISLHTFLERNNQPFASVAELFAISAEYLRVSGSATPPPWTFPSLDIRNQETLHYESIFRSLDARMLDAFTVANVPMPKFGPSGELLPLETDDDPAEGSGLSLLAPDQEKRESLVSLEETYRGQPTSYGRINLNTAPVEILRALPGASPALVEAIHRVRVEAGQPGTGIIGPGGDNHPFRSLSEFATHPGVWANVPDADRFQALLDLTPAVTTASSAFRIISVNTATGQDNSKRETRMGCQAVIQMNGPGQGASMLSFNFQSVPTLLLAEAKSAGEPRPEPTSTPVATPTPTPMPGFRPLD